MDGSAGERGRRVSTAAVVACAAAGVVIILHLLQPVARVLLLVFAGTLYAVFIDAVASALVRRTRMPRGAAVGIVVAGVLGVPTLVGFAVGPGVAEQVTALFRSLPETWSGIRTWLQGTRWGPGLLSWMPDLRTALHLETATVQGITVFFSTVFQGVVAAFLVVIVGVYVALSPSFYVGAVLKLVPQGRRERYREVARAIAHALRRWLAGRIVAMTLIGTLVSVGLSIIGVPYPLAFGFIAALLEFVPYVGPTAAAVPPILVALAQSPVMALLTIGVFAVVQAVENALVSPLVEHRAVRLGPAVLVSTQVLMGVLFGGLGVLLATPLAVVVVVAVQKLYIEDVLGEATRALGEGPG
jgi:predicted PurR-regulated permease PerM